MLDLFNNTLQSVSQAAEENPLFAATALVTTAAVSITTAYYCTRKPGYNSKAVARANVVSSTGNHEAADAIVGQQASVTDELKKKKKKTQ